MSEEKLYPYGNTMKQTAMKRAFALQINACGNEIEAARAIEPNWQFQHYIINNWVQDPEVLEFRRDKSKSLVVDETLPTKDGLVLEIITLARDRKATVSDKLKCYELAAKVMNFIEKPAEPASNTTNINTKVFVLPARATSIDEFELHSSAQQAKLINAN